MTELTPDRLAALGVKGLLLDLDNTLAPWNDANCPEDIRDWLGVVRARGVSSMILSNNVGERVMAFAAKVDLPWLARAGKPRREAFRRALDRIGTDPSRTLAVGDRLFMDVVGGNRMGLRTVLVRPLSSSEFWGTRMVRFLEGRFVPGLPADTLSTLPGAGDPGAGFDAGSFIG